MKLNKLFVIFWVSLIPMSSVLAATTDKEPSNSEIYQMLLDVQQELKQSRAENERLANLVGALPKTAVEVLDNYDETKPVGRQAVALETKLRDSYLTIESQDQNIKYTIDGRIMLDTGYIDNSRDAATENDVKVDTGFRRLRLAVKGRFYKDWAGELDLDFADETGAFDVKDAWISYEGIANTVIKLGNHKPHFSMDEVTTSRWVNLIERSMVSDVFSPSRRIGVSALHWGQKHMIGATFFGDEWQVNAADEGQSERFGWSARGVFRPLIRDGGGSVIHLGFNVKREVPQADDGDRFRLRARPETRILRAFGPDDDGTRYLNTGRFDADSMFTHGFELAAKKGPYYLQGEYMQTKSDTPDGLDPEFSGWYIKGAWLLSGGERQYNVFDSEFGPVLPTSSLGAFELVARISELDLNDAGADILGGSARNLTLGLNWYLNNNFIFRFNYINVDNDANADGDGDFVGNDDLDIYAARFQYVF